MLLKRRVTVVLVPGVPLSSTTLVAPWGKLTPLGGAAGGETKPELADLICQLLVRADWMAPTALPMATELKGAVQAALLPPPLPLQLHDQLLVPALTAPAVPPEHRLAAGT